jgi:hypothetical protein
MDEEAFSEDAPVEGLELVSVPVCTRLQVSGILAMFLAAFGTVVALAGGLSGGAIGLWILACACLGAVGLVVQPFASLEPQPLRLVRGVKVLGLPIRWRTDHVAAVSNPVVVEHFKGAARQRREGWYLGIRVESGRTAWLAYSVDHAKIEARAKPVRVWLRQSRRQ